MSLELVQDRLVDVLTRTKDMAYGSHGAPGTGTWFAIARATGDTWSRAARRKKIQDNQSTRGAECELQLICKMSVGNIENDNSTSIEFQWIKGRDRGLFESFMSHIGRKVGDALKSS